jgi:hypothetical protein
MSTYPSLLTGFLLTSIPLTHFKLPQSLYDLINQDVRPHPTAIPSHPPVFGLYDFVHTLLEYCRPSDGYYNPHQPELRTNPDHPQTEGQGMELEFLPGNSKYLFPPS